MKNVGKNILKNSSKITIKSVYFKINNIIVELSDGKVVDTPINSYPNLNKGTQDQLNNYQIKGNGRWIHWEELDEDLSAEGFLAIDKKKTTTKAVPVSIR